LSNHINYGSIPPKWPFPVKYDEENRIETDVLVIGAGIAGSMAGLMAARRGVKVAVVDKAPIDISGSGGAGLDHYGGCISNPDCGFTPEEYMELLKNAKVKFRPPDHRAYIQMKGAWDNLLELEKLGLKFRDEEDEFVGAPFRDDKTKIMYAYDYKNKDTIKLRGGADIKAFMRAGLTKEKNATLYERVMITNLLTEDGRPGTRIVGATGINEETGEFYIFSAKCAILCTAGLSLQATSTWTFNSEMFANGYRADPRVTGEGFAMAWKAGAEFLPEEQFGQSINTGPFGWPWYGVGNPDNTWHGVNIVDDNGKEMPYRNSYGDELSTVLDRFMPSEGKSNVGVLHPVPFIDAKKIESGEYVLPLWADLSAFSDDERRSLWGLMVGNEGRTRTAIYDYFNKAGFNPDTDMLQCPVMTPYNFQNDFKDWYQGEAHICKAWKADTLKGVITDWNQMTSIEGLFAAGSESDQGGAAAGSSGGYSGNRAAEYAIKTPRGKISEEQVAAEKKRVYAPVKRMDDPKANVSWKELWMGLNRVMQQDCGEFRSPELCEHGIKWLDSIKKHEMQMTYARNPHELSRVLECESRVTTGEIYLNLCKANFRAAEQNIGKDKIMLNKFIDGELITTYKEAEWWLKPPCSSSYLENYTNCRALEKEEKQNG